MNQTWYYTSQYSYNVRPVSVVRSTHCFVWIDNGDGSSRKEYKDGVFSYWPTKAEALDHLKQRATRKIEQARAEIGRLEKALAEIEEQSK